jgi:hypothetical protein
MRTRQQPDTKNFHAQSGSHKREPHCRRWKQHKRRENEEKSRWKQ